MSIYLIKRSYFRLCSIRHNPVFSNRLKKQIKKSFISDHFVIFTAIKLSNEKTKNQKNKNQIEIFFSDKH